MNLLRAHVRRTDGWWELKLLDLDIVADGATEDEMLQHLEHALTAEYHLARKFGRTPFVNILLAVPTGNRRPAQPTGTSLRPLTLPDEVRQALAAAFRRPSMDAFAIEKEVA
jgi:hypothetical protein